MTKPILLSYKASIELPLEEIYLVIELREENGITRAYNAEGEEVCVPSPPESAADLNGWLHACSPSVLEAARQYYHDKWLWDSGDDKLSALVNDIVAYRRIAYHVRDVCSFYCPYIPIGMTE